MKRNKKKRYISKLSWVLPLTKTFAFLFLKILGRRKHYSHLNNTYFRITNTGIALQWTTFVLDYSCAKFQVIALSYTKKNENKQTKKYKQHQDKQRKQDGVKQFVFSLTVYLSTHNVKAAWKVDGRIFKKKSGCRVGGPVFSTGFK